MDQQTLVGPQPASGNGSFAFNGEMLVIAAIITVFFFLALFMAFHLYVRWWFQRGEASASRGANQVIVVEEERRAGLDTSVLSTLPAFVFSAVAATEAAEKGRPLLECAVCLSEFEEKDIVRLLPGCGHNFHIGCIDMWFHSHSTCPLCRSPVEPGPVAVAVAVGSAEPPCGPEPAPSGSESGRLCPTCQRGECSENVGDRDAGSASSGGRGKAVDVRIEVCPPRLAELDSESTQFSPVGRLLSLKRLLSMGRKSPRPESSGCGAAEVDLEGGLGEPVRVHIPK